MNPLARHKAGQAVLEVTAAGLVCRGRWTLEGVVGLEGRLLRERWPRSGEVTVHADAIEALDTTGALLLLRTVEEMAERGVQAAISGLQESDQALVDLVRERRAAAGQEEAPPAAAGMLERLGQVFASQVREAGDFLHFVGEASMSGLRALRQPHRVRWRAIVNDIEQAGVRAMPIIALMSFLMGVVIAYQGGTQLKTYGANIFIVELVSLTMLREIAPLLTAIIVAGRTGSAYTAQIGTMQVTEEVDALRTIGISPMDLLVLPKLVALAVALPLLTIFADALSVFGGMVMAAVLLDVTFLEFLDRFPKAVTPASFMIGVGKAPLFAAVIALVGCFQGFRVHGGADAVGRQTTVSVVQAIFLVIIVDAALAVVLGGFGL